MFSLWSQLNCILFFIFACDSLHLYIANHTQFLGSGKADLYHHVAFWMQKIIPLVICRYVHYKPTRNSLDIFFYFTRATSSIFPNESSILVLHLCAICKRIQARGNRVNPLAQWWRERLLIQNDQEFAMPRKKCILNNFFFSLLQSG